MCTEPDEKEPARRERHVEKHCTLRARQAEEDPQGRHLMTYAEPGKAMSLCSRWTICRARTAW